MDSILRKQILLSVSPAFSPCQLHGWHHPELCWFHQLHLDSACVTCGIGKLIRELFELGVLAYSVWLIILALKVSLITLRARDLV